MSWFVSLAIASLTGLVALFASGTVAALAVDWYSISSFEGGSGFFVIFTALFGGMAGAVLGLIAARVTAARPHPSFFKGLGNAVGVVLILTAGVAGIARLLADVPPAIGGETLLLHVELRSPAGDATDLAELPGVPYVRLGVLAPFSNVQRVSEDGPLWIGDVRREDGRWIVPGAVPLFTARGKKIIDAGIGERLFVGLLTPLSGSPSTRDLEWSPWYPQAPEGEPALPDQFTLRYRLVKVSDAVRTLTAGPFTIDQRINDFSRVSDPDGFAARGSFAVRHRGQPVPGLERLGGVAMVAGPLPALAVRLDDGDAAAEACRLVVERDGQPVVTPVSPCANVEDATPLTSDSAVSRRAYPQAGVGMARQRHVRDAGALPLPGGDRGHAVARGASREDRRTDGRNAQRQRAGAGHFT